MADDFGESNPFSPTVPDSIRGVSQDLYDFLHSVSNTLRDQHNKTQAGDPTFPWTALQVADDMPAHNLGSLGSFYHPDFGVVQGRYVRFANMADTPVGRPVTLLRADKFSWTVTNDPSQGSDGPVTGLGVASPWPKSGQYGWVLTQGVNLLPITLLSTTALAAGAYLGWDKAGAVVPSNSLSHDFGQLVQASDTTGLLAVGEIYVNVSGFDSSSLKKKLSDLDAYVDDTHGVLESKYVKLTKTVTDGLNQLTASYSFDRQVTVNPNEASVSDTTLLNAIANFVNQAKQSAGQTGKDAQITQINLAAANEAMRLARVYRDDSGYHADSVTTMLNVATAQSNLASYSAVSAASSAASASDSAAQASQSASVGAANSTNLLPPLSFPDWGIYNNTNWDDSPYWGMVASNGNAPAAEALMIQYILQLPAGAQYTVSADLLCFTQSPDGYTWLDYAYQYADGHYDYSPRAKCLRGTDFSNTRPRSTYALTLTVPVGAVNVLIRIASHNPAPAAGDTFAARRIKLELGDKATGYTEEKGSTRLNAYVNQEILARVTADNAEATARQQLGADLSSQVTSANARINSEQTARVNADGALAGQITTVNARFNTGANQAPNIQFWEFYNGAYYEPNDFNWGPIINVANPPAGEQVYAHWRMGCYGNRPYTVSADMRAFADGGYVWMDVIFYDGNGQYCGDSKGRALLYVNNDFDPNRNLSLTMTSPSNAYQADIRFCGNRQGNYNIFSMRRPKWEGNDHATPYSSEGTDKATFAQISYESFVRANADGALSGRVDSVSAQYNGLAARVEQTFSAVADSSGNAVARWQVSAVGSNGRRAIYLNSDTGVDIVGDLRVSGDATIDGTLRVGKTAAYTFGSSYAVSVPDFNRDNNPGTEELPGSRINLNPGTDGGSFWAVLDGTFILNDSGYPANSDVYLRAIRSSDNYLIAQVPLVNSPLRGTAFHYYMRVPNFVGQTQVYFDLLFYNPGTGSRPLPRCYGIQLQAGWSFV